MSDDLINIGNFSLASGLSVSMLRYYHDAGVLVPASIDAATGYRRYSPRQLPRARLLARLRALDVPVAELAPALDGDLASVLRDHRDRLARRLKDTKDLLVGVDELIAEETRMTTTGSFLIEVLLKVHNLDATANFYRDVLGIEFESDDHNGAAPRHYDACGGAWTREGAHLFTLWPAGDEPETTGASIGFGVPDLAAVWARAEAAGAALLSAPADDPYIPRNAAFADPAGNRVAVYERAGW